MNCVSLFPTTSSFCQHGVLRLLHNGPLKSPEVILMKGSLGSLVLVSSWLSPGWKLSLHSEHKFFELNLEAENIVLKGHHLSSGCYNKNIIDREA